MNMDRRRLILNSLAGAFTIPFANLLRADAPKAQSYDYIIIGAGTAGCIVAARLAEHYPDASVLLVEAGGVVPSTEPMVWDPSLYMLSLILQLPDYEWGYESEPQAQLENRTIALIRGKGLGGCSLRNGMVYVRGGESGFDEWAAAGAKGWNFQNIRQHFEAVEKTMNITKAAPDPLTDSLVIASKAAGLDYTDDYNAQTNPLGVGPLFYTIRNQRRETTHTEFLAGRHFPNLSILTENTVHRITSSGERATGVVLGPEGANGKFIAVSREVILSAGTIASPQILMLSGIGDREALGSLGISSVRHLPGVGQNLQDDVIVNFLYISPQPLPPQSYGIMGLVAFAKSQAHTGPETDLQFHFGGAFDQDRKFLMISPMILLADSRGEITLQSANPFDKPRIDPRYLTSDRDWTRLIEACQLARSIAANPSLDAWRAAEIAPGPSVQSETHFKQFIREQASTGLHYAGTCKMGIDAASVVDPELRVHGFRNLRVVDASIIPRTVSGNTAAATMMIAHRGASLILGEV